MAKSFVEIDTSELTDFMKDLESAVSSISNLDNTQIIKDGKPVDNSVPFDPNKLSNTDEEAISEADYIDNRKQGEINEEGIDRYVRDLIHYKSGGIF